MDGAAVFQGAPFCSSPPTVPASERAPSPPAGPALNLLDELTISDGRLAIETDYQFFQNFGSTPAATDYVTQLIAAVSEVYLEDANTTLSIAYLGIWDNPGDPWSTPDTPGNTLDMLDEFQAAWGPGFGGSWPVSADLAHFMSGASLGGGRRHQDSPRT